MEDGAQICLRSSLIAHMRGPGQIILKKNAFIGANAVITAAPGRTITVGEGAVVAASSVISSDVPAETLFGMDRAKPLARASVPLTMQTSYDEFLAGLRPLPRR